MMRPLTTQMAHNSKENMAVQSLVERPHEYSLGRCRSSEVKQLAYIHPQKACLQSLSVPITTSDGIPINDVIGFFHGDGLQQEFEAGEQKGGNARCASCGGDARKYKHLQCL